MTRDLDDLTCVTCGVSITWEGNGRPPKYCTPCNPRRDKMAALQAAKIKRAQERLDKEKRTKRDRSVVDQAVRDLDVLSLGGAPAMQLANEWHPRLLACALGLESDPMRAVGLVGIQVDPADFPDLLERARRHKDLTERRPAAVGALLGAAVTAAAIRLTAQINHVPISQLATTIRAIAQAHELIAGTTQPQFSEIRLVVRAPDGSEWHTTGDPVATA